MNFFDYEITRTAAETPQTTSNDPERSLNEDVSQVVGQLGRFWGGFRKQSQAALETARKDLTSIVAQAQKEFEKLSHDPATPTEHDQEPVAGPSTSREQAARTDSRDEEAPACEKSDGDSGPEPSSSQQQQQQEQESPQAAPFQSFLSRVQSSLPPNLNHLSETFERALPVAFKDSTGHLHMPSTADLAQLRSEFGARVQDVLTRTQADEYVQRSEALLREAGEYLLEAVKVVPPEGSSDDGGEADVVFDGMGLGVVVMPPKMVNENKSSAKARGKGKETDAQARINSRAAAMLAQLRQDPDVLNQDPAEDDAARELYEQWFKDEIVAREGGISSDYWTERIEASIKDAGEQLKSTKNALVPSSMDSDTFWTRYFFRVYQIEKDEERRRLLLASSGAPEDHVEFTWEDDDEESSLAHSGETTTESQALARSSQPATASSDDNDRKDMSKQRPSFASPETSQPQPRSSYPSSVVTSPSNASPRVSSDEYDVVSATSAADTKAKTVDVSSKLEESKRVKKDVSEETDEEDSDWE